MAALSTPPSATHFVPTRVATLRALDVIECDLYIVEGDSTPTLYGAAGVSVTPGDFDKLQSRGIDTLYVGSEDALRLHKRLRDRLEFVLQNKELDPKDRFGLLQTAVSVEIEQTFRMINVSAAVERAVDIGDKIAGLLRGGETLLADLMGIVRHDFYTFTHVTNVAAYAVLLAEALGIRDAGDLKAIATGALLHDLGKRMISPAILNKPERLSAREQEIIQTHPLRGYEELHDREDLNHGQLMMVYQHHEKLDGSGYPVKAAGDDIHPWARLCAVVDIFDAMTCDRPYRKARKTNFVLEHLSEMAGDKLDKDMVTCFISKMTTGR